MGWFNSSGMQVSKPAVPFPKQSNCLDNDYEKQIWSNFVDYGLIDAREVVKWEKLEVGYYKATLEKGDIIFYISTENSCRRIPASEAKFHTQKLWSREFSRRFNYAMEKVGMNQQMLSEKTGISQASLSYYNNCQRVPSAYTVRCIADALRTTVGFLSDF